MIGPQARDEFHRSLRYAREAEGLLRPGMPMNRLGIPMGLAVLAMIRGVAYTFLNDNVTIQRKEDDAG